MHVPFGWVSLVVGVLGAIVYIVNKFRGADADFTLLAASVAAFVAGWVACVSIPRISQQMGGLQRHNQAEVTAPKGEKHS